MSFGALLDSFQGIEALVIGDLMVDEYIHGRATRISPEAPVMVVRHRNTERLPGGAANVARNLLALGAKVATIGISGDDRGAELLEESLLEVGLEHNHLVRDSSRTTTRKVRVLADATHQALRIDFEDDLPVPENIERQLLGAIQEHVPGKRVVILSDYLKGALTPRVCEVAIRASKDAGAVLVANPKPRSLPQYRGADLVSLNRAEATQALDKFHAIADSEAVEAGKAILEKHALEAVLVTLGEGGMAAVGSDVFQVEAVPVEVYDTAGAGDTVIATVALGLSTSGFKRQVFELAAQTAASVVRHVGVATPSGRDLELLR